jgi:hypothetical protein
MKRSAITILAAVSLSQAARAESVEFALDSTASSITLSGTFQGIPFIEQTPGSLTSGFDGSLQGDLTATTLDLAASHPRSLFQTVPQQPKANPEDSGLAAYGMRLESPNLGQVLLAIRRITFYLSTEFGPPLEIADGSFAPSDLGFFVDGGTALFTSDAVPMGGADLHGHGSPNQATVPGTFTTMGDLQTLTIPIATTFSVQVLEPDDLTLHLEGQFVGTRVIPEPAVLPMLGAPLLFFATVRRRKIPATAAG